jgi:hypothetical protein
MSTPDPSGAGHIDGDAEHMLARALVRELEHTQAFPRPWGAFSSFFIALLSLGVLPMLLWHDRFRDFVDQERQYLRRFADWIRLQSARPETMDLRVAGDDLGSRSLLSTLGFLCILGVCLLFAVGLNNDRSAGSLAQQVLAHTYNFHWPRQWTFPLTDGERLFAGWSIGLSIAYLFHWLQVQSHASDVRRFVGYANSIFRSAGIPRIPQPRIGLGIAFFWMIAGAILASKGAWWGLAMALTGAAQQRYMGTQSLRLRRALAARVREMACLPAADDTRLTGSTRRCPHARCLAPIATSARFCPRCGHNVAPAV